MRAVIQRVSKATVTVDSRIVGSIGKGFLVLLGVAAEDEEEDCRFMADRILGLRVFADAEGKMNLDLRKAGGELLIVPQFTLLADNSGGRRPSFIGAARPEKARPLCAEVVSLCRQAGVKVEEGEFGAMMDVALVNDGPVTILLDSRLKS